MQNSTASTSFASQIQLPSFHPKSKIANLEGWGSLVDEFVKMQKLSRIMLVTSLSSALKGEAEDSLIRSKSLNKIWEDIRTEFIDVFKTC